MFGVPIQQSGDALYVSSTLNLLSTHTTIGQTQVDFIDFHRWFETNSWILMSHMSFDMTSFSFRLTCPV